MRWTWRDRSDVDKKERVAVRDPAGTSHSALSEHEDFPLKGDNERLDSGRSPQTRNSRQWRLNTMAPRNTPCVVGAWTSVPAASSPTFLRGGRKQGNLISPQWRDGLSLPEQQWQGAQRRKNSLPKKSKVGVITFHISLRELIAFDSHKQGKQRRKPDLTPE